MLLEVVKYHTTPCPAYAKKMGYLAESIATGSRHFRNSKRWKPHLERSRKAILDGAAQCKKKQRALILGSGHHFDIPLRGLCEIFDEVLLVDLIHPRRARRNAKFYPNAGLIQADVTGIAEKISAEPNKLVDLEPDLFLHEDFDYVVSANIMGQLPMVPSKWLKRNGVGDALVEGFSKQLVEAHLNYLKKMSGRKCLITDLEFVAKDRQGNVVASESAIYDLELPKAFKKWNWDVAPAPEIDKELDFLHKVGVYYF